VRLVPTAISVVCPVCKGSGKAPIGTRNPLIPYPCEYCRGVGKVHGTLAPVGYDGVSAVEWPESECERIPIRYAVVRPNIECKILPESGHCAECRWWNDMGCRCLNPQNEHLVEDDEWGNIAHVGFDKDFGCIHFERREG
jgi:hypothetical protein